MHSTGNMQGWNKADNTDFKLCKSYPPLFYIPVRASRSSTLQAIVQFRFVLQSYHQGP